MGNRMMKVSANTAIVTQILMVFLATLACNAGCGRTDPQPKPSEASLDQRFGEYKKDKRRTVYDLNIRSGLEACRRNRQESGSPADCANALLAEQILRATGNDEWASHPVLISAVFVVYKGKTPEERALVMEWCDLSRDIGEVRTHVELPKHLGRRLDIVRNVHFGRVTLLTGGRVELIDANLETLMNEAIRAEEPGVYRITVPEDLPTPLPVDGQVWVSIVTRAGFVSNAVLATEYIVPPASQASDSAP